MAAVDWGRVPWHIRRVGLAQDEAHRRRRLQKRDDYTAMQNNDYKHFVTSAPQKAASIFRDYKSQVGAVSRDPMIPEGGKLYKAGELHRDALKQAEVLSDQMETAAILTRKELSHKRDQARPKVDAATHERRTRQFAYLIDRNVSLDELVSENAHDPEAIRVLQDEAPIFARGQQPRDPQAGEGYAARLDQAAYEAYGDAYRTAADRVKDFDGQHYRAKVAVNTVVRTLREGDDGDISIPDAQEGQMIDC